MPKIADYTVAGKSGTKYQFEVYPRNTSWKEVGAVYLLTKRVIGANGKGTHTNIYVGQTGNMAQRHTDHHKEECFDSHGANCTCVLVEPSEPMRLKIESDILQGGKWPCNG